MKSDYRLGRNFYKGVTGDAMNILLVVAVYNFKRAMKALWDFIKKVSGVSYTEDVSLKWAF